MLPYQYIERPSPFCQKGGGTLPVFAVTPSHVEQGAIEPAALDWARKADFKAKLGALLLIPTPDGHLGGALFGLGSAPAEAPFLTGKLARLLPHGDWHIETAPLCANRLAMGFGLGSYSFDRYRAETPIQPRLLMPADADGNDIRRQLAGVYLAQRRGKPPHRMRWRLHIDMQENGNLADRQIAVILTHLLERHRMPKRQGLGRVHFDGQGTAPDFVSRPFLFPSNVAVWQGASSHAKRVEIWWNRARMP